MRKEISLSDLRVNTENYRFEPLESEEESIDYMVADQKEKLLNLVKDILSHGFNPHEEIMVYPSSSQGGKYVVLEGNRRVISLKLLKDPSLIRGKEHSVLKKKFKKLNEENKPKIIKSVNCFIYDDPAEAEYWVGLKHGYGVSGVGTEEWGPMQKDRFREKTEGKSSIALQIINKMKSSKHISHNLKKRLKELKPTNLGRLMADPEVRKSLGIEMEKGELKSQINEKEVMKGLTKVAEDLLEPTFKVKKIYSKEERKNYIKDFPVQKRPNDIKTESLWYFNKETLDSVGGLSKIKPYPKERRTLIPKSCTLKIKNPRINKIYYELLEMDTQKFPNASAVLFRVFVELSLDTYLEENKLETTKLNRNSPLKTKINGVIIDFEKRGIKNYIFKGVKTALSVKDDLLGIDTWNAYVHNDKFSPSALHLITTWDNIQPFIEKIWGYIK